jgi:hypothetical protein
MNELFCSASNGTEMNDSLREYEETSDEQQEDQRMPRASFRTYCSGKADKKDCMELVSEDHSLILFNQPKDKIDEEVPVCAVCQESLSVNTSDEIPLLLHLSCNHRFHADCLEPWLRRSHTCPICRQEPSLYPPVASRQRLTLSEGGLSSNPFVFHLLPPVDETANRQRRASHGIRGLSPPPHSMASDAVDFHHDDSAAQNVEWTEIAPAAPGCFAAFSGSVRGGWTGAVARRLSAAVGRRHPAASAIVGRAGPSTPGRGLCLPAVEDEPSNASRA